MPFFYVGEIVCTAHAKRKKYGMGEERQALLLAEKASMAGEAAEALQDIETQAQHHHGDEA